MFPNCSLALFCTFSFISGPVLIMVLEKENAVADWRAMIGPTDARKAKITHPYRFLSCDFCPFLFACIVLFQLCIYLLPQAGGPLPTCPKIIN